MPNLLTTRATLMIGLFPGTLVKHYFAKVVRRGSKISVPLRREELLYDETFNIVKVLPTVCLARESYLTFVICQDFMDVAYQWFRSP